jgi:hypothetical protein
MLFTQDGAAGGKLRAVPERCVALGALFDDAGWDELQIPVGVAFFLKTAGRAVAFYPGPAGAAESLLSGETWERVLESDPRLASLAPEVEALLVAKEPGGSSSSYVVPIDLCYELVGRLKRTWKGFDGGEEARRELAEFAARLAERAGVAAEAR